MKKRTKLALVTACLFAAAIAAAPARTPQTQGPAAATPQGPSVKPAGTPAPFKNFPAELFDRELKGLDGRSLLLSAFKGQVFVVNLWASWCGPCRIEVPELNKIHDEYAARGVAFVGLTVEDPETDAEKVLTFVEETGMKYTAAWADQDTARILMDGRGNLPQTLVVAADGRILVRHVGYAPKRSPAMLREAIGRALGDKQ